VKKAGRFVSSFENSNDIVMYGIWIPVTRLVSVFVVLFFVAPFIGWMYFGWSIIFFLLSVYFARRRMTFDLVEAEKDSKTTGQMADVFTNVLNVKMFSSRKREEASFNEVATQQMHARSVAWNYNNYILLLQGMIVTWLQIASLYVSITLWFDGLITLGTIALAYTYSGTIFDSVWNLGKQLSRLSKVFSDAAEMVDVIDNQIEIEDSKNPEELKVEKGEIVFQNMTFSYKQGKNIFTDFNLKIPAGEKVGVVGTSGAGKTTITKLLLRFADVTGGSILLDGQDIRNITQDDLRSVISYVPQDPILFHRSLRENICYGKPDATEEEIIDASKKAHAHEFISGLKHGYDTMVGERGVKLSGGERQRVALARAILKNAPILILDEATSALDSVSEEYIQDALNELMKGKTVIVIAHRLSTIQKLDRILVMEKGAVIEEGRHKALIAKKGTYADFWNRQAGGFIE
jgi:ATP-binding cassette subfamily B protein